MRARFLMTLFQSMAILLLGCTSSVAQSPEEVVRTYWEAMIRRDYERAWDTLRDKQKKTVTKEQYVAHFVCRDDAGLAKITRVVIKGSVVRGNRAMVYYNLPAATPDGGERDQKGVSETVNEEGRWALILPDRFIKVVESRKCDDADMARVAQCTITALVESWDEDNSDDGLVVYPFLKDSEGRKLGLDGVEFPIEISVFVAEGNQLYSRTHTVSGWECNAPLANRGIKIPFDEIETEGLNKGSGTISAVMTLPDGRILEAKKDSVRIKASAE